ncbi:MAG: deoxyribodipyrimidine photo-lyase [Deinococcales bacterium]
MIRTILWHRGDLRLRDHEALWAALAGADELIPLLIIDDHIFKRADLSSRRKAWFLENVRVLRQSYRQRGSDLVVLRGLPEELLPKLAQDYQVQELHYLASFTPYGLKRDALVKEAFEQLAIKSQAHQGLYGLSPGKVLNQQGEAYKVYSPFMRRWRVLYAEGSFKILSIPEKLKPLPEGIEIGEIEEVESDISLPEVGESAAWTSLRKFFQEDAPHYHESHNFASQERSTSQLSYYFSLGILSARQAFSLAEQHKQESKQEAKKGYEMWQNELIWREFSADLLYHNPQMLTKAFNSKWQAFPWREGEEAQEDLACWQAGQTGYPLIDAGMRELAATGFMHNRLRMLCASFLTKNLLISWQEGEAIFKKLLLDGDTAQNVANWQWVAGCGADAAPYFRIFNPILHIDKFNLYDYIRRWCPELTSLSDEEIKKGDYSKVKSYPQAMVDHYQVRDSFLSLAESHLKQT